jgi:superfamily II DNA or RNA helicase
MAITTQHRYAPGSLVRARGRDWVVLPAEEPDVLRLRPLTGRDEDEAGLFWPLEGHEVATTHFPPPEPDLAGDASGAQLLCDAARLSLRSGAAPFRSLGRIAVRPRPYQFVPLIMALRQDPVRLLIADDVGVGKTIEAGMIARELLDRGLARRLAVICPAHLCDQWESEFQEKFGIEPAVIQPSRISRLERDLPRQDISIYQYYQHQIVSIDFIKSDRNRGPFLDNAPDLIIVDEAHIAARPQGETGRSQHQRHDFLRQLARDPNRHILLVTATPHSGIEESYRSLLGLLNPEFDIDSSNGLDRKQLLPYIVQRQRSDLAHWLGSETDFPERDPREYTYSLSPQYQSLFEHVLDYCRETVRSADEQGMRAHQRRVRHWAAIALLRCLLSSPFAAAAVLSNRQERLATEEERFAGVDEVDETYRPQVLDLADEEASADYVPSAPLEEAEEHLSERERRRLRSFVNRALDLVGPQQDRKLARTAEALDEMLRDGHRPIVYCRFIQTAKYLESQLTQILGKKHKNLRVKAVTGELGEQQRREVVDELAQEPVRILVATDCLSEGVNLQQHFDAVIHYDLPWNPNRLEQREGRVDRFGQPKKTIRTAMIYGADNPVDLVVLNVLIRKAQQIRHELDVAVPLPVDAEQVIESVVDNVLLSGTGSSGIQTQLPMSTPEVSRVHQAWDEAADRQGKQRAFFSQRGIQPDEVAQELEATDPVLGDPETVQRFMLNAVQRFNGDLREEKGSRFRLNPGDLRDALVHRGYDAFPIPVRFRGAREGNEIQLGRIHPIVATICDEVLGRALSPDGDRNFPRTGAIITDAVQRVTGVALLRIRYALKEKVDEYAEEVLLAAFQRRMGEVEWLEPIESAGQDLISRAKPIANIEESERHEQVQRTLDTLQADSSVYQPVVDHRVEALQASHQRLRKLVKASKLIVEPQMPPDLLGLYVLVPGGDS